MPVYKKTPYTLKLRGSSYQVNFRATENGQKVRFREQRKTQEEAVKFVEETVDRLEAGLTAKPPTQADFASPSIRTAFDLVFAKQWKGAKNEVNAKRNGEDCVKALGETTPVNKITTGMVDQMIADWTDKGLSGGTIHRKLAALSCILKFAARRGMIETMPFIDKSGIEDARKRLRWITEEEEKTMLDYMKTEGLNDEFFAFLIDTGLRMSEALDLTKQKIHTTDGQMFIMFDFVNKGEQPRMVPLTSRATQIVTNRLASVLPGGRIWHDMDSSRAERQWKKVREFMKLVDDPDFVPHACRHTFATRLAMADVDVMVIKQLGGWKTLEMVMRYAHLRPSAMVNAINKMQGNGEQRKIG